MSLLTADTSIDLAALRQTIQSVEPAALLVEPRILRRVIKQDRRLAGLGLQVPHRKSYTIQRDRLLVIVDRSELALGPGDELPKKVILLAAPTDGDYLETAAVPDVLYAYWRWLFHARVHLAVEHKQASGELTELEVFRRRQQLGAVEFDELRAVLDKDDMLLPPASDLETYSEFAAVYLELRYFAPKDLATYFPAIRDWKTVDQIVSQDVDHARLFRETRLEGAPTQSRGARALQESGAPPPLTDSGVVNPLQPSPPKFWRLVARAERAGSLGNGIKAAILRTRARRLSLNERAYEMQVAAHAELERVVRRLRAALDLPDNMVDRWATALTPLLERASRDRWSSEARLLYDLQKVCVEHERGVYRVDIVHWLKSLGRAPLRRPLPLLRQVLITKHLRTAANRLSTLRVDMAARERLALLLADAFDRAEEQLRGELRPRIAQALESVGLRAENIPQRVSAAKIVEELLDGVVQRGFARMGDLRDALSRSDLKLPDVAGVGEILVGDKLLRANRQLEAALQGVYRPGEVYLRWPQTLSSLAFGTAAGRFLTQYVALPFGGAYLGLEFIRHMVESAAHWGESPPPRTEELAPDVPAAEPHQAWFVAAVLLVGTLILLLIHRPAFRHWCIQLLLRGWRFLHLAVVEWPTILLHSPIVQRVLQSQAYAVIRNYVLRPALYAALVSIPLLRSWESWDWDATLHVFLGLNLFLNSPFGRYADERATDLLVRAWHELRIRVFAAVYHWIMDVFDQLLEAVERLLYMVDEWLRFRRGDVGPFVTVKLAFGPVWSLLRYIVRICMTLVIEPQVNPIKHFPVVTVSHKMILPWVLLLAAQMKPYFGAFAANSFAAIMQFVLPGVFGFLVWELKENWRLYAANRPPNLTPSRFGSHGETMLGLLRPGIHSGTLPKLFTRLRRAARKAAETGEWKAFNHQRDRLHHVTEDVRRFVEREFCALLQADGALQSPVTTGEIHLATNRIDVELMTDRSPGGLWLAIEERSGWLTATVRHPGWLEQLTASERTAVEAALAGLYKRGAVDLVRERLGVAIQEHAAWYEIVDAGLAAYTNGLPAGRILYPLRGARARILPLTEETTRARSWPTLNRVDIVFADTPIPWREWVAFWSEDQQRRSPAMLAPIPHHEAVREPARASLLPGTRTDMDGPTINL